MAIEVGKQVPAFSRPNQRGETVSDRSLLGQWYVLYFYPRDDTPGCTTEACEFSAQLDDFAQLGARVLGVSPDPAAKHQNFIEKYKLAIDLLCDEERSMLTSFEAYGEKNLYGKKTQGVLRSTLLVDPAGKVAHHWKSVRAKGHAQQVHDRLKQLRG